MLIDVCVCVFVSELWGFVKKYMYIFLSLFFKRLFCLFLSDSVCVFF